MMAERFVGRQRALRVLERRRTIAAGAFDQRQQVGGVGDPRAVVEPLENGESLDDAGTPVGRAPFASRDLAQTQQGARDVGLTGRSCARPRAPARTAVAPPRGPTCEGASRRCRAAAHCRTGAAGAAIARTTTISVQATRPEPRHGWPRHCRRGVELRDCRTRRSRIVALPAAQFRKPGTCVRPARALPGDGEEPRHIVGEGRVAQAGCGFERRDRAGVIARQHPADALVEQHFDRVRIDRRQPIERRHRSRIIARPIRLERRREISQKRVGGRIAAPRQRRRTQLDVRFAVGDLDRRPCRGCRCALDARRCLARATVTRRRARRRYRDRSATPRRQSAAWPRGRDRRSASAGVHRRRDDAGDAACASRVMRSNRRSSDSASSRSSAPVSRSPSTRARLQALSCR